MTEIRKTFWNIDEVRIPGWFYIAPNKELLMSEVLKRKQWCIDNAQDDWHFGRGYGGITFGFKSESDAILFKLCFV